MSVAQLIEKLKRFDQSLTVVVRQGADNFPDDFIELKTSDLTELQTKKLFNEPIWHNQLYDASEGPKEKPTKVLSLSGPNSFERARR